MKKRIVILMLILLVSVPFYGQKKSKFGVHTGATYSKEVGQHLSDVDKKYAIDFMVGISLDYYLTEKFSIKANLSYDRKTYEYDIKTISSLEFDPNISGAIDIRATATFAYITLPLMLKYDFKKENGFFVNAGPYAGLLLDMRVKAKVSGYPEENFNYTNNYNSYDFGISAGIGKSFKINEKNDIVIEIRDNLGLIPLNIYTSENGVTKINSINLIAGWSFDSK
jgi:hypothetical protein